MRAWVIITIVAAVIFLLVLIGLGVWLAMADDTEAITPPADDMSNWDDVDPEEEVPPPGSDETVTPPITPPPIVKPKPPVTPPVTPPVVLPPAVPTNDQVVNPPPVVYPPPPPATVAAEEKMLIEIGKVTSTDYKDYSASCYPNYVTEMTMRGYNGLNSLRIKCNDPAKTVKTAAGWYPNPANTMAIENVKAVGTDSTGFNGMTGIAAGGKILTGALFDGTNLTNPTGWRSALAGTQPVMTSIRCPAGKKITGVYGKTKHNLTSMDQVGTMGIMCG